MKMVLVYYLNLKKHIEYYKILKYATFLEEGMVNQYDHQIMAIYYIYDNKVLTKSEYKALLEQERNNALQKKEAEDFANLQQFIDFLENLKRKGI